MSGLPLLSVAHCNVNCTNLARSRRFYESLGLATSTHTKPDPQDGTGFGIDGSAAWDAWMMHDHRGPFTAPVVDLLQWLVPTPLGSPFPNPSDVGLAGLRFSVPSLDGALTALDPAVIVQRTAERAAVLDPDGVRLVIEQAAVAAPEHRGVTVNVSDLERSREWYQQVLGLVPAAPKPQPAGMAFGGAEVNSAPLSLPGQAELFTISLEHWDQPPSTGRGYAEANHVGIFRMAFMVHDIDAGYEQLRAAGVECFSPPVTLDMGPEIPIDGLRALFFPDPDGACLELIETLRP